MRFLIRLIISVGVIVFCAQIGRKLPTLAGLIAVMPLTGLIVLVWLYADSPDNAILLARYCKGAVWGILPSVLFFLVAWICFRKHMPLYIVLAAGFFVWLVAAAVHQLLLHK